MAKRNSKPLKDIISATEAVVAALTLPVQLEQAEQEAIVQAGEAAAADQKVSDAKPVPTLHVKQGLALRGGRGEWYKLLCRYDGKPVAEYVAEGKVKPASHYTARSTKCGQPKTPESRLSWFKRAGIVTIS